MNGSPPWVTLMRWCSLNSIGDVSKPTLLIMLHGSMRSVMWWVPTKSLTLHMESGALLVEVMTCSIHVLQIIGLWDSGGPVPRKNENLMILLTTSFTYLYHRGCLITRNSNALQMTVLTCGLLTETVYPRHHCHDNTSEVGVSVDSNAVVGASSH